MIWFYKLLGYRHKIVYMRTHPKYTEFDHTLAMKVPIDRVMSGNDMTQGMKENIWVCWDFDSIKQKPCKSATGSGYRVDYVRLGYYYNPKAILDHFNKLP